MMDVLIYHIMSVKEAPEQGVYVIEVRWHI